MSRLFYTCAILFTALAGILILIQSIVYFLIGPFIMELTSARGWLFFFLFVTAADWLIMIAYCHYRKYQFALWSVVAMLVATCLHVYFLLKVIQTREITPSYALMTVLTILAGITFGISLVFSRASERYWLRVAGIFSFLLGLIGLSAIIWGLTSVDARVSGTFEKLDQWLSISHSIIPIFFLLNFINERSATKSFVREGGLETVMGLAALVAFIAAPIVGVNFINEALWRKRNPDFVWEGARRLAAPFEEGSFVASSGDTLRYRLMLPLDYDSAMKYPVVVCLHGSSGSGHDNIKQIASCLPASWLSNDENRRKYPAILFVPQCPQRKTWGGLKGAPAVGALVMETLLSIEKDLPVDTTRRYIAGNSMGGYGTWVLAGEYPEKFAAAVPICGGGDPALAQQLSQVPIWAFHGEKDMNVPVSGSRDVIEAIKKVGGKPIYTEFSGKAHDIGKEVTSTPGLLDWLFSQRNNP